MPRAFAVQNGSGQLVGYSIECPACGHCHLFNTEVPTQRGHKWTFNGNLERPTFQPSMNVLERGPEGDRTICHSFVTDGRIQYLADCAHQMAGQTVDLPEIQ